MQFRFLTMLAGAASSAINCRLLNVLTRQDPSSSKPQYAPRPHLRGGGQMYTVLYRSRQSVLLPHYMLMSMRSYMAG